MWHLRATRDVLLGRRSAASACAAPSFALPQLQSPDGCMICTRTISLCGTRRHWTAGMANLRVGLIGAGANTKLRHLPGLRENAGVTVTHGKCAQQQQDQPHLCAAAAVAAFLNGITPHTRAHVHARTWFQPTSKLAANSRLVLLQRLSVKCHTMSLAGGYAWNTFACGAPSSFYTDDCPYARTRACRCSREP